jgi:hypothetical protein
MTGKARLVTPISATEKAIQASRCRPAIMLGIIADGARSTPGFTKIHQPCSSLKRLKAIFYNETAQPKQCRNVSSGGSGCAAPSITWRFLRPPARPSSEARSGLEWRFLLPGPVVCFTLLVSLSGLLNFATSNSRFEMKKGARRYDCN